MIVAKTCTENFTVQQLQLSTVTFFQPKKLKPKSKLYKCWKTFFFNFIGLKLAGIVRAETFSWEIQTKIY